MLDSRKKAPLFPPAPASGSRIQRKCAACAQGATPCAACEQEKADAASAGNPFWRTIATAVPPKHANDGGGDVADPPASVDRVLADPGQPLGAPLRQDMEHRFGYDFSGVRVHDGARADRSARDVQANAYAIGRDIVFGAGRFAPATPEGRRLIAHELTHVVQQSSGGADAVRVARDPSGGTPSPPRPTVTPEIEAALISELQNARVQAPTTTSIPQEARRTFAVAAIIKSDGSVTYHSAYFDKGTEHAEPQLLAKIRDRLEAGDYVAIAIDQVPCSPTSKNCQAALKQFRTDPNHGSLRVFTVRAMRRDAPPTTTPKAAPPGQTTSPKTAITRPIEERFLIEEKELRRIRLPMYPQGPATPEPTAPSTPPVSPPATPPVAKAAPPAAPAPDVEANVPPLKGESPEIAPPAGRAERPAPKFDRQKALKSIKARAQGGGMRAALKGAAAGAALDFLNNMVKAWIGQEVIERETEAKIAALQPAIDTMLATAPPPKQIHAVIHVQVITVTQDKITQQGVEEKQGFPMVYVGAELSETAVAPTHSSKTDLILMGSIDTVRSTYSVLLIDVEKEQARQEVERKEQLLRDRMAALAREEAARGAKAPAPPEPPRPAGPPSLMPPPEAPPPSLLPGAPGPNPFAEQEARAAAARDVAAQILADGRRLRDQHAPDDERQRFKRKVQVWRGLVHKMIRDFGNYKAVESLQTTVLQFDERMRSLGSELGIDGWQAE